MINPFKSKDSYQYPAYTNPRGEHQYNYNEPRNYRNNESSQNEAGAYKYHPKWEGGNPSLNSPYSMNTNSMQGPPQYLEPHEESKYNSQDEEDDESDYEGEESESEYDSEISKTEDYRSNSSMSNYAVPERGYPNQVYSGARESAQYPEGDARQFSQYSNSAYFPPNQNAPAMYQSFSNQGKFNLNCKFSKS